MLKKTVMMLVVIGALFVSACNVNPSSFQPIGEINERQFCLTIPADKSERVAWSILDNIINKELGYEYAVSDKDGGFMRTFWKTSKDHSKYQTRISAIFFYSDKYIQLEVDARVKGKEIGKDEALMKNIIEAYKKALLENGISN